MIEHKMNPTPYRKIDISHSPSHHGFWSQDWSAQGKLDNYAAQRDAVEGKRGMIQTALEEQEASGKLIQRQGHNVYVSTRKTEPDADQQVLSSPHAKVVRFYHVGNSRMR